MGLFTSDIKDLNDLFVHTLQDIYYAENQIVKALPEMISKASDATLRQGLEKHLNETRNHVQRLEQVFQMHGVEVEGVDCPAIDGIIEEAEDVTGEAATGEVMDAAIVASAQAVEHYEITRYGSLIAWAKRLGRSDCASVLQQIARRGEGRRHGAHPSRGNRRQRARRLRRRWGGGAFSRHAPPPAPPFCG